MAKKEIRFGDLVKTSGTPEIVTLWMDPQRDRTFMRAVKENRVLTVLQEPASKRKDFARIGFHQEPHASYLVFPKPLPGGDTPRVIGIKYDLVEPPRVKEPIPVRTLKPAPEPQAEPQPRQFNVILRRLAIFETSIAVSAADQKEAKRQAIRSALRAPFDLTKAVMRNEVIAVQEASVRSASPRRRKNENKS